MKHFIILGNGYVARNLHRYFVDKRLYVFCVTTFSQLEDVAYDVMEQWEATGHCEIYLINCFSIFNDAELNMFEEFLFSLRNFSFKRTEVRFIDINSLAVFGTTLELINRGIFSVNLERFKCAPTSCSYVSLKRRQLGCLERILVANQNIGVSVVFSGAVIDRSRTPRFIRAFSLLSIFSTKRCLKRWTYACSTFEKLGDSILAVKAESAQIVCSNVPINDIADILMFKFKPGTMPLVDWTRLPKACLLLARVVFGDNIAALKGIVKYRDHGAVKLSLFFSRNRTEL